MKSFLLLSLAVLATSTPVVSQAPSLSVADAFDRLNPPSGAEPGRWAGAEFQSHTRHGRSDFGGRPEWAKGNFRGPVGGHHGQRPEDWYAAAGATGGHHPHHRHSSTGHHRPHHHGSTGAPGPRSVVSAVVEETEAEDAVLADDPAARHGGQGKHGKRRHHHRRHHSSTGVAAPATVNEASAEDAEAIAAVEDDSVAPTPATPSPQHGGKHGKGKHGRRRHHRRHDGSTGAAAPALNDASAEDARGPQEERHHGEHGGFGGGPGEFGHHPHHHGSTGHHGGWTGSWTGREGPHGPEGRGFEQHRFQEASTDAAEEQDAEAVASVQDEVEAHGNKPPHHRPHHHGSTGHHGGWTGSWTGREAPFEHHRPEGRQGQHGGRGHHGQENRPEEAATEATEDGDAEAVASVQDEEEAHGNKPPHHRPHHHGSSTGHHRPEEWSTGAAAEPHHRRGGHHQGGEGERLPWYRKWNLPFSGGRKEEEPEAFVNDVEEDDVEEEDEEVAEEEEMEDATNPQTSQVSGILAELDALKSKVSTWLAEESAAMKERASSFFGRF